MGGRIQRTVSLDDITPHEMAMLFAELNNEQQAHFFNYLAIEAMDWSGTGWCQQASVIAPKLTPDGVALVLKLAEWINDSLPVLAGDAPK